MQANQFMEKMIYYGNKCLERALVDAGNAKDRNNLDDLIDAEERIHLVMLGEETLGAEEMDRIIKSAVEDSKCSAATAHLVAEIRRGILNDPNDSWNVRSRHWESFIGPRELF